MRLKGLLFTVLILHGSLAAAAPDGAALFRQHCAACHGEQGQGGVGVPLALPAFLGSVDDRFLFNTIRNGRPGRVMPAFKELSDAQVSALVAHLRSWMADGGGVKLVPASGAGDAGRGKGLFAQHCAACHGANGEGGHGTGVTFSRPRDLPIIAPALNNSGFLAAASDAMIKTTLMRGREGTPMVSFLQQGLSEQDIDDIVAYVRSFEQQHTQQQTAETPEPILVMESPYSLEETVANVERAAVGMNFRIIRIQRLEDGLFSEEEQSANEVIVYFCNFNNINQALALDPRVGLFMPCRITVVERDGVVQLMSINPRYLSRSFNNAELNEACEEMYSIYESIMEEATI